MLIDTNTGPGKNPWPNTVFHLKQTIMKNRSFLSFLVLIFLLALNGSCSSDDGGVRPDEDGTPDNGAQAGEVEVSVLLPEGSTIDLSKAKLVSLGSESDMESDGQGELPYNSGNLELGYLMDSENNVLLLGFLSEHRKEISIRTTTEAMLYFGLDYYLLEPSIKQLFLDRVTALDGFDGLVDQMEELFLSDELMYQNGDYIPVLDAKLAELAAGAADRSTDRLFMYGEASKSGLTVLKLDSVHVDIQNILPR